MAAPTTCLRAARLSTRLGVLAGKPTSALFPASPSLATQTRALSSSQPKLAQLSPAAPKSSAAQRTISIRVQYSHRSIFSSSQTQTSGLSTRTGVRFSSTSTSTSTSAPSPQSIHPSTPPPSSNDLTWDRFLHLRTIRRRYNTVASAITALATTFLGAGFIANQDPDNMGIGAFGLDPIVVMGMATLACGAVGWVVGPFMGSAVFGGVYRRWRGVMDLRERDFFRRIKKYRVSPVGQSVNNPVPDYYGEKISSVRDYRRWLKDQRAFRKKRDG
ncbi:MAG: TIM23 complex component [Stictis urceolatum]|nr:TIM23 complex component [Stictis urceolata]